MSEKSKLILNMGNGKEGFRVTHTENQYYRDDKKAYAFLEFHDESGGIVFHGLNEAELTQLIGYLKGVRDTLK